MVCYKRVRYDAIVVYYVNLCKRKLHFHDYNFSMQGNYLNERWSGYQRVPTTINEWKTGIDVTLLKYIGARSVSIPDDFVSIHSNEFLRTFNVNTCHANSVLQNLHPHLRKTFVNGRLKKLEAGNKIDWATAEALAIGSLLHEGYHVRLCGQDVGRGTFSQRHAMLVDQQTNEMYIPLNDITSDQKGFYEV